VYLHINSFKFMAVSLALLGDIFFRIRVPGRGRPTTGFRPSGAFLLPPVRSPLRGPKKSLFAGRVNAGARDFDGGALPESNDMVH
jgi:hypothetical protein